MYRLVGMESQAIHKKMKCLMYIAVIQFILGKIVLYESVYITYKYEVYKYDVLCKTFSALYLGLFSFVLACRIISENI